MNDRDAYVLRLRREGATLSQVGQEFGIGKERVRQIELRALRFEQQAKAAVAAEASGGPRAIPVECAGLSVRAANVLRNEGLLTLGDVADALVYLNAAPTFVPNFGKKTLAEVKATLEKNQLLESLPVVSRKAAMFLSGVARTKQQIAGYFGHEGQYGPNGKNLYQFRDVDREVLNEVRSLARALEGSASE